MKESNVQTELNVSGMHCANCAISIHKYLENNGAKDIYVDFASDEVKFSEIPLEQIPVLVKGIESLGYKVIEGKDKKPSFWKSIEFKFLCCLIFTIPLWSHMFTDLPILHDPYIQLALCVPVYIIGFSYFGISAFRSIWNKMPNMDVLIFVGSTAAFSYSLIGTYYNLGHDYQFYETCATIITLVFLGNVLEKRAVTKTTSAIKELVKYQDIPAIKIEDDQEVEILAREIKSGDILKVNSGNQIPADGDILEGQAWVDESMLTGESVPIEKLKYDAVIGGTLLTEGNIRIMATKVGSKSVLYQIIQLIKDAQSKKPPIQKFGDKVAAYFVPIVVTISFFTFFITYFIAQLPLQQSLMNAIATLVVSCPCAMGLATPTAVMVGLGRAAKKGILIKGGSTIEEMSDLKQMVFDKTGTLTTGDFNIKAIQTFGIEQSQVESIIAQLESYSSHPIAKSIRKQLKEIKSYRIIFKEVNEIKGKGIFATDTNGNNYSICNAKLGEKDYSNRYDLALTINGVVIAGIVLEDQIKPYAKELIQYLKDKGIRPILLSGDRQSKCERTAQKLGIADVYWDKSPEEKLEILFKLKKNGPTAMVGDGINDAPALAAADVGISLGDSTHIAIQSAKVVLLSNDLKSIEKLLKIGHHTLLTIKQNLFWAFAYNIVAIPLAAVGFLGPMLAALSMAFSDLIVIGNSIRLRFKKIK
ncbi:cadmium-translocating P-type ATPase [Sphingobacterium paramultivorum]|uniref:Cadmium-translocating P-type ATPase n=1 Tax=Sphingobacterium paramultivorum TaxID=2886510 RepID=A0A7G5E0A2_9SPHI|nr:MULTISPECIES: cation-translocating P-type ATPase [Sphingobacterium]MCS4164593.1 Cu+-exporting ATPase [Sphingobacterium sp. BIGb0116]QMV67427.1 cadmium-translocating P-type ATPase [Sphingobacterium paramultivorum]WSO16293.1 cation-translocating P-type ATPase [Sphingobacterium paramultivorum]